MKGMERAGARLRPRKEMPFDARLIEADGAADRDEQNREERNRARIPLHERTAENSHSRRCDQRPALPVTHLARWEMRDVLKAKRADDHRERDDSKYLCNACRSHFSKIL